MNFCYDCRHYHPGPRYSPPTCSHPTTRASNPVSGFVRVDDARGNEKLCGHDGRFFNPRPPKPSLRALWRRLLGGA